MKKILLLLTLVTFTLTQAQTPEIFKPYKPTDVRLPAVPIIVNDPYFSIWSPYDKLNDGTTRHWTGANKPITGLLRVDGTTYRFMGSEKRMLLETILPMATEEIWTAQYSRQQPEAGWESENYKEEGKAGWKNGKGAFGSESRPDVRTKWNGDGTDIFTRRYFDLTAEQLKNDIILLYSHDDVTEFFINGTKVVDTGLTWRNNITQVLTPEMKKLLHTGRNVIAAHGHNTSGGAMLDFGLYLNHGNKENNEQMAVQKSVDVLATSSYYTFACGPVDLNLVFTAPMLYDDYDLLSTPINYVSYQVQSTDGKEHQVQFFLSATPEMGMNNIRNGLQPSISKIVEKDGIRYAQAGTIEQPILASKGDHYCIDWGYFYLPAVNGEVSVAPYEEMLQGFEKDGKLLPSRQVETRATPTLAALAYVHNFGSVGKTPQSSFTMLGYDEVQDIEYLYHRYKAYWAHDGNVSIFDAFNKLKNGYTDIMNRCRALDKRIYDDGMKSGNKEYAEMLSGTYRHVIAAHKLFKDNEGNLLFFSKENDSNGSVNTVDLTYPEAPLFLTYNPELQKAMMTSIFDYSKSGRWTKPFAAHDMGTYPIADGQTYTGDMPLEEAGNMIILATTISMLDGNTKYADKYWDVMTTWVNYLVENGQDPANQLCTDDFAGHWAHNCNLSVKAIMGILGYAKMASLRGDAQTAQKYEQIAKNMAVKWEKDANEGDHYRLAFDRDNTWSQKYNMVWDKLWKTNIFPNNAMEKEVKYYLTKQNKYGLPLDCRKDYTKSDWIMWSASMAKDNKTFLKFVAPVYKYINETESRVPLSDWHDTKTGLYEHFICRSVIGGYWMKVLMDKMLQNNAGK